MSHTPSAFPGWLCAGWHSIRTQSDLGRICCWELGLPDSQEGGSQGLVGRWEMSWWWKARSASKPQMLTMVPMQTQVCGPLSTCQACAIQERALCGLWSTKQALRRTGSLGLADSRKPPHTTPSLCVFSDDSVLVSVISWLFYLSTVPLLFYAWVSASPKTGLPICLSVYVQVANTRPTG